MCLQVSYLLVSLISSSVDIFSQGSGVLDTHAQKSRARLAKTGVLAKRRKPPRSSWYVEDGQKIQEFMFTDSTGKFKLKIARETLVCTAVGIFSH